MPQDEVSEDELVSGNATSMSEDKVPESESSTPTYEVCTESAEPFQPKESSESVGRVTRLRAEGNPNSEENTSGRRLRRRLDTAGHAAIPLTRANTAQFEEDIGAKKMEVMERQLDLDIMTFSEDGLSPEAVEYLRLQRAWILRKIRKQTEGLLPE